jgi:hypothetical protein
MCVRLTPLYDEGTKCGAASKLVLTSFLRRQMAFPTSQQLYNVKFCTGARVPVETEAHRVHVHEQRQVKKCTCVEQNHELSAWVHDVRLWAEKPTHMKHMAENEKSRWISPNSTWN